MRKFRPNFIDTGDGTKKMDPMLGKDTSSFRDKRTFHILSFHFPVNKTYLNIDRKKDKDVIRSDHLFVIPIFYVNFLFFCISCTVIFNLFYFDPTLTLRWHYCINLNLQRTFQLKQTMNEGLLNSQLNFFFTKLNFVFFLYENYFQISKLKSGIGYYLQLP